MFRPASLFVGLRYVRSKRRDHFISVISLISIICFALGVTALITVLSVMNGFDEQIRARVFSMAPQVTISSFNNVLNNWQGVAKKVEHFPHVIDSAPFISGQGMLTSNGIAHGAMIFGVEPSLEKNVSQIEEKTLKGNLENLQPGEFGIFLGHELADSLGVDIGDKVTLLTPSAVATPVGMLPRYKRFNVVGVFSMGNGFGFDSNYAYVNLKDAQTLYQMPEQVTGLRLKLDDLYEAPAISDQLREVLPPDEYASNWTQTYGAFFQAIAMEKTMMFCILLLIILVAAFSLVSTLFMVVTDKKADVAILRTMGATPRMIMGIFMVQGTVIGLIGNVLGLICGVVLALNVTELANTIQKALHVRFLASNVYYIDYLPSKIEVMDVINVCLIALFISVIATIIPARRAAKVQPAEALRYE